MLPALVLLRLPLRLRLDLRLTLAFFFKVPAREGVMSLYAAVEALETVRLTPPSSRVMECGLPTASPTVIGRSPSTQSQTMRSYHHQLTLTVSEIMLRKIAIAPVLQAVRGLRHRLVEAVLLRCLCIRSHVDHSVVE